PGPPTTLTSLPGFGPQQVQFRGGHLLFAFTSLVSILGDPVNRDGAYWVDIEPQLTAQGICGPNQCVAKPLLRNVNIVGFAGAYVYLPSLLASSELDEVLSFNFSGSSTFPSLFYMARRPYDAPNTMAQGAPGIVGDTVDGTSNNTTNNFGLYSTCALNDSRSVRSIVWCVGEYAGTDPTWNTRIVA